MLKLVKNGKANPSILLIEKEGCSAAYEAIENGHEEIALMLLQNGVRAGGMDRKKNNRSVSASHP